MLVDQASKQIKVFDTDKIPRIADITFLPKLVNACAYYRPARADHFGQLHLRQANIDFMAVRTISAITAAQIYKCRSQPFTDTPVQQAFQALFVKMLTLRHGADDKSRQRHILE